MSYYHGSHYCGNACRVQNEPIEVESTGQFKELVASNEWLIIDFYASWCGPCQQLMPIVHELAGQYPVPTLKVNVDTLNSIAASVGVRSLPTILLIGPGQGDQRKRGMLNGFSGSSRSQLSQMYQTAVQGQRAAGGQMLGASPPQRMPGHVAHYY